MFKTILDFEKELRSFGCRIFNFVRLVDDDCVETRIIELGPESLDLLVVDADKARLAKAFSEFTFLHCFGGGSQNQGTPRKICRKGQCRLSHPMVKNSFGSYNKSALLLNSNKSERCHCLPEALFICQLVKFQTVVRDGDGVSNLIGAIQ